MHAKLPSDLQREPGVRLGRFQRRRDFNFCISGTRPQAPSTRTPSAKTLPHVVLLKAQRACRGCVKLNVLLASSYARNSKRGEKSRASLVNQANSRLKELPAGCESMRTLTRRLLVSRLTWAIFFTITFSSFHAR